MENQRHDEPVDKMTVEDLRSIIEISKRSRRLNGDQGQPSDRFDRTSGCGKSTFLRTLNRMNDLIEGVRITGSIKLDGVDIYAPGRDVVDLRKRVGMVFQRPNPFPKSIFENVVYGPRRYG